MYRVGLVVLVMVAFWAVWASAQQSSTLATNTPNATNAVAAVAGTNAVVVFMPGTNGLAGEVANLEKKVSEEDIIFHLDKINGLRENKLFGQPLWKYISSLIFIFLAFFVSKFLDYVLGAWLKRWAAKTETKFDDLLLEAMHGPIKVVGFVIFLHIGLAVFEWPPKAEVFLSKGLIVIVAFSITYVTLKIVDLFLGFWRDRTVGEADKPFNEQLFPLIQKSIKVFVVVVAVLVTSQNLGINITGVLASLSIGGLALGLAAQDTLSNLFGAVAVYLDKPFHIGDRIQVDTMVDGVVESIGLRSTRVKSLEGHHVAVPNKTMGNAVITNVTRRSNIKTEMNFGLTYDTPTEKVKQAITILQEIFKAHPNTEDLIISFNKFADSSLNIYIVHWWKGTDGRLQLAGMQELNLKIKERFDAAGINFAFPSRTIYLKQDGDGKTPKSE